MFRSPSLITNEQNEQNDDFQPDVSFDRAWPAFRRFDREKGTFRCLSPPSHHYYHRQQATCTSDGSRTVVYTRRPVSLDGSLLSQPPSTERHHSNVMKPQLVQMVLRQPEKWPGPRRFNPSKTKVADLKHHLLNSGFTKEVQAVEDIEEVAALGMDEDEVSRVSVFLTATPC
jgi:hypothetical protein